MKILTVEKNDSEQRLDRFFKKHLKNASLSQIYKIIRKDLKVNGKRKKENDRIYEGDILEIYISDLEYDRLKKKDKDIKVRKNFKVIFEDENMLIASKPFGLLTHGDSREKKNHLANQVINYLISEGKFTPEKENTFSPSPVNRLDRNTTGLVIFGKNAKSLKELNQMIKNRDRIKKYYLTVVHGKLEKEIRLYGNLIKDEKTNRVKVVKEDEGKQIETVAKPLLYKNGYTLVEVELVTGRTHQIRAHLSGEGYSIIGDIKYGGEKKNQLIKKKYRLTTQFLHAYKLIVDDKVIIDNLPENLKNICIDIFGSEYENKVFGGLDGTSR